MVTALSCLATLIVFSMKMLFSGAAMTSDSLYTEDRCLTYEDRYAAAHQPLPLKGLNSGITKTDHAVLMMMPQGSPGKTLDVILNLRSMASECTGAGYHFYIVKEVPRDYHGSHEDLWNDLPADLHPYLLVHSWQDTHLRYPKLAELMVDGLDSGPGPFANYLAPTHFMNRYQAYEFAWIVEWDNRFIGNWGYFFNAALSHASEATQIEDKPTPYMRHGHKAIKSRVKLQEEATVPGFISFEEIISEPFVPNRWHVTVHNWNTTTAYETEMMVWGGSRKLFDALHRRSLLGQTSFQTIFVPTIAHLEGLRLVHVDIYNQTEMFHCCSEESDKAYLSYHANKTCLRHNLIHPVKNRPLESWPLSEEYP